MITILRNATVYAPEYQGKKDILLLAGKIAAVSESLEWNTSGIDGIVEIDASGKLAVPGFVDSHVHLLGGGGEGGYHTRTPEIMLTDLTLAGVTTVVGCLGTDGITRNMMSLLAKARGFFTDAAST